MARATSPIHVTAVAAFETLHGARPSLTILATVINDQYPGRSTTDAGAKACSINQPWPIVKGESDSYFHQESAHRQCIECDFSAVYSRPPNHHFS